MIRIYKQRDYRLQKVKVIESIFCRIRCEFSNSTLHNQYQVRLPSLSENSQKIQIFPKHFLYYLFHFCPPDCSTPPNLLLLARDYCSSFMFHQDSLLQYARYFQNHHSTRNCYFSPPDISRIIFLPETATSDRQVLLYYCIIT